YSRFWAKFLYDIDIVPTKEPYMKRTAHGMILGENGEKMSKSRGNVINPDDTVAEIGADAFRMYEMFMGAFDQAIPWSTSGARGCRKFLDRVWRLQENIVPGKAFSPALNTILHETIKKVTSDIDELKMNTAIAALMAMVNEFYANGLSRGDLEVLMLLLSPFAPHMVEEMWELTGYAAKYGKMAMQMSWPQFDESKTVESNVEMAVQVKGKLRGTVTVPVDSDEATVLAAAKANERVAKSLEGMEIVKTILVKNKLINLIVKPC
ncbi:MAG: class I tRNA ligase family protein, partial [Oscillospiraceae bacterium]|nr:class I tRNA ligase family protein [Oscillospiraceae bacterium]